jgi:hypothetical protein
MLSYQTAVNIFILIAYNRSATRQDDTWFFQVSARDYDAPQPPPGTGPDYPPCTILYETPKIALDYPKVETPLTQDAQIYNLEVHHLYHPESPPILNPPLPASFRIDVEQVRKTIITESDCVMK